MTIFLIISLYLKHQRFKYSKIIGCSPAFIYITIELFEIIFDKLYKSPHIFDTIHGAL